MMSGMPRVAFHTLGCKVNQQETEALAALFSQKGYEVAAFTAPADVYVINTCTVTHLADRKSRHYIRRCLKTNPRAKVVVMGCYAQAEQEEVARIPGVSLVVGSGQKDRVLDWLGELDDTGAPTVKVGDIGRQRIFEETGCDGRADDGSDSINGSSWDSPHNRARAYLKIQEGCEQFCAYCIIPYVRGPLRSRDLTSALREAEKLIAAGFREIVLTGIHVGAYGREKGSRTVSLERLMARLLPLSPTVRWRLSSIEPTEVSAELLELMAGHPNFCPHLHLPLQSGHNQILRAMRRPYTTEDYHEIVNMARSKIPYLALTTDIMVGFPGETEAHVQEYLRFVDTIGFSGLHVFQYSARRGTAAALFPQQVPAPVKAERSHRLIEAGRLLAVQYAGRFIGRTLSVLAETEVTGGYLEGHSENYLTVRFEKKACLRGEIVPVRVCEFREGLCYGEAIIKEGGV